MRTSINWDQALELMNLKDHQGKAVPFDLVFYTKDGIKHDRKNLILAKNKDKSTEKLLKSEYAVFNRKLVKKKRNPRLIYFIDRNQIDSKTGQAHLFAVNMGGIMQINEMQIVNMSF